MTRTHTMTLALLALATPVQGYDFSGFQTVDLWDASSPAQVGPSFLLHFNVNNSVAIIGAEIVVTDDQWFSVGVSSSGGMIGADMAIFTSEDGADYTVGDYWTSGFATPVLDAKQNIEMLESSRSGDTVTVVWRRPTASCDQDEDLDLLLTPNVVFAVGAGADLAYHQFRGSRILDWKLGDTTAQSIAALEEDAIELVLTPTVPIALGSDEKTQYHCASMPLNLPDNVDYHNVATRAVVGSRYIHHMLYFVCDNEVIDYDGVSHAHNEPFACGIMPPSGCESMGAWAVGGKGVYYNQKFGQFLSKTAKTMFIQYHYDNYDYASGVEDTSGAVFTITPTMREFDLGQLVIGVSASENSPVSEIDIPAGETAYRLAGELPAACSEKMLPDSVQIVGVGFHMHEYGTNQFLEHWRGDERLPDIASQYWDFNFQTGQMFSPERWVEFRRGDQLRCNCEYDTVSADQNVKGGDGSDEEMCLCFVSTFPPMDVQVSMAADKLLEMVGMPGKVLCIANTGDRGGLSAQDNIAGGGTGNPAAMLQRLNNITAVKSIPEATSAQLPHPQAACTAADLHDAHVQVYSSAFSATLSLASSWPLAMAALVVAMC